MKISDELYIVASGSAGFGITNRFDCTVFLVKSDTGFILIDAGSGLEEEKIIKNIIKMGFSLKECRGILITHAHADHIGGIKSLAKIGKAPVYAWKESAHYIENGQIEKISLPVAIEAGLYPKGYSIEKYEVNSIEEDGGKIEIDGLSIETIHTPGHCSGHCSYLLDTEFGRTLFSGDCIFLGGKISLQNIWDCNLQKYEKSIKKLAKYRIDALIPSHFGFVLSDGKEHVLAALDTLNKLGIPENAGYF